MNTIRSDWRRPIGALNGLALGLALASGCGSTEDPLTPATSEKTAPRDKAATTSFDASADASASDASLDQDAAPDHSVAPDVVVEAMDASSEATLEAAADADATPLEAASRDTGPDAPTGPAACGLKTCAPGAPCADLIVDVDDLRASIIIDSRTFAPTDCAVVEGCIAQPGTRRLLRFDTGTANIGTADLVLGDPTGGACFQFSQCHQHYHFQGFSQYTLYKPDGRTLAATGHKQSFCLEDVEPYQPAPAPDPATPFTCTSQGLHVGWEDIYPNDIDCQWVDITGVPAGDYLLTVAINTAGYLPELNYANDSATVPVTIPAP
jgi:hypothetical protein